MYCIKDHNTIAGKDEQLSGLKEIINSVIDDRLKDFILIPKKIYFVDEQGYRYIYTDSSFSPLKGSFKMELKQAKFDLVDKILFIFNFRISKFLIFAFFQLESRMIM